MLVVTSYGASDSMFMLFQQNYTTKTATYNINKIFCDLRSHCEPLHVLRHIASNTALAVPGLIMKIKNKLKEEKEITIMKNTFFAKRAAYKKVYANMKTAHPDWNPSRLHAATKAVVDK